MARRCLYLLAVLFTFPSLVYSANPGEAAATEAEGSMLKAPFTREEAGDSFRDIHHFLQRITNRMARFIQRVPGR
jgi:hypothetical protein